MPESLPTSPQLPASDAPTMPPQSADKTQTLGASPPFEFGTTAPDLPGYEILGELGRGGMGVVYKARQIKLNRVVALKMILAGNYAAHADLIRFLAEAEAVAGLQHPNIVQLFETGQHGRLPYFTLEYIDGGTLSDKVREQPLPPREAATLVEQVARGVQFAHDKGLVHRDLKPDNVLMTADGTPKVADFGLAKRMEVQSGLTQTGAILGTPSYMAPEQADRKNNEIGPLADVYALGAMLYRLVAGRPPFQAATPLDTLVQVVGDEPVAPSQLQPKTPRDLETICLKCLQKEPSKRYASAKALADDLSRFLRGEPIVARPVGAAERALKWVKRNPMVTTLVSAIIVSLLVGALISYLKYREASFERGRAEQALKSEADHRRIAERARDRTRQALDAMTSTITGDSLSTQKEISDEQKKFLTQVLSYYQELADEKGEDEKSRLQTAQAAHRVGLIEYRLGHLSEAATAMRQACRAFEALVANFPQEPVHRQNLATNHHNLGLVLRDLGQETDAEKEIREALKVQEALAGERPDNASYRYDIAKSHNNLGGLLNGLNRREEAEEEYHRAMKIGDALVGEFPKVAAYRQELALSHDNFGMLLFETGKLAAAKDEHEKSEAMRQKLVDEFADNPTYRQNLAKTLGNLGNLFHKWRKLPEAEQKYRKAVEIREKLAASFPSAPGYRYDLAAVHSNLGLVLTLAGKWTDAEEEIRKALAVQAKLTSEFPETANYPRDLATTYGNLANLQLEVGKLPEAEESNRKALAIREKLAADFPDVSLYRQDVGFSHHNLANVLSDMRKWPEGEKEHRQAIAIREKLATEFPGVPDYRQDLAVSYYNHANTLSSMNKRSEAEDELRKGLAILQKLVAEYASAPEYRYRLGNNYNNLGNLMRSMGRLSEAEADHREALALREKLAAEYPSVPQHQIDLGGSYCNLGNVLTQSGRATDALTMFDKAITGLTAVFERDSRSTLAKQFLRNSFEGRARAYDRLEKPAEAEKDWDKAIELTPARDQRRYKVPRAVSRIHSGKVAEAIGEIAELSKESGWNSLQWYDFACVYAIASAKVADKKQEYADRAMELLTRAVDTGFSDLQLIKSDADLNSLRQRDDFKKLVAKIAAKSAPGKTEKP